MHSKQRNGNAHPILQLSERALAQLSKLASMMQASRNLHLSERDLDWLLRLIAQGELLDPALHAQLVAILMRHFSLRHIPLRMPHWWKLARRAHARSLLNASVATASRRKWQLVPYKRDLVCPQAPSSLARRHLLLDSRNLRGHTSRSLSHLSSRRKARKLFLMAFYSNAPLLNSFSCILFRIGRESIRNLLASILASAADDGDLSLNALEYLDGHGHSQLALNALCREFAGEVRLVRTNIAPRLIPKSHECTLPLSLITHASPLPS